MGRLPVTLTFLLAGVVAAACGGGAADSVTSESAIPGLARVVRVVDGDTIDVQLDGSVERVRYIGIDTPETVDPRRPVECFGHEASRRNTELVEGQRVELERDVSERDAFGRLLRYVYVDGQMVNALLVQEGYAFAVSFPPDVRHQDLLRDLERVAREEGRGLWGACPASPGEETPPTPTTAATSTLAPATPTSAACPGGCVVPPQGCVVKGNISFRTGEKIYHVPGGEYYDETVISPEKGERWFCTEEEAVAAGWRRSRR